ncbi:EAL and HDOD domain-containing protein [methane-oxidizing endosymbiont of Gigantopelta aegis]|uniref:EAL and HDOD domain-containing protein n=1 Tax=methane-oxidizing endosymbiont of Gigantopelta aegis TaxID=2794938 RepID=UPI0018DCDD9A|nr:HDOD domain-containing protein [methane-oxidizing endosymbiont of Gigantopelta aegis]
MQEILIGRQQILDHNLDIFAYEILFRGRNFDISNPDDAHLATNQVISDTLLEIGLNNLVGSAKAFVNFTEQNLLDKTPLHLPKDRVVIEVLEGINITPELVSTLKEFSNKGYTLALDDFILTPEWLPLLEFADIIKLDIMQMPMKKTLALIEQLKPYQLTLLAEKVETHEEFQILQQAGCSLFQGFFFKKPETIQGKRKEVNQTGVMNLLAKVNQPDVSFNEISHIINHCPSLAYKLLHYINSSFFAVPRRVESISHAVSLLGLNQLKQWINILTLSSMTEKPLVVIQSLMVRAKICELLAPHFSEKAETLFMIGMFSGLDSLMDAPLDEIIAQLPLEKNISDAILHHSGTAGQVLALVLDYEKWENSLTEVQSSLPPNMSQLYLQSIEWTNQLLSNAT